MAVNVLRLTSYFAVT